MKLNIKNIFLFNDESFKDSNIDDEKYNLIKYCVQKERQICKNILFYENIFLYNKSLELINAIINYKYIKSNNSKYIYSTKHRSILTFENDLQKQIFINNFVFPNNKNMIKFLKYLDISNDKIKELATLIEEKKKEKNPIIEIDEDFNIKELCQIYKCKYPSLIINKIFELYYKNPELFNCLKPNKPKTLIKK